MAHVLVNAVSLSSGALTREQNLFNTIAGQKAVHEFHILCRSDTVNSFPRTDHIHRLEVPLQHGPIQRIVWENTALLTKIRQMNPDIMYFPLHLTNLIDLCPKISAIRNAAPFCEQVHAGATWQQKIRLRGLRAATKRTIAQSKRVVFLSQTTKETVAESIPEAGKKGIVIPHGVPPGFEPTTPSKRIYDEHDLPEQFLLSVSNIVRYKNLEELAEGYALADEESNLPPLYIAGKTIDEAYKKTVKDQIQRYGIEDSFSFLGFIDHEDLPELHTASEFFVFSSACENAPITLIEALACGSPIATSQAASMPEICGDAAVYFDPFDPQSIAETLIALWEDTGLRQELSEAARERAESFSWEHATKKMSELFGQVARGDSV